MAADAEGGRREDRARGARREESVGAAGAHGGAGAHDGGVLLLAHGRGGVLGHRDDLLGHEGLGTVEALAEGLDDLGGTADQDAEVRVALERLAGARQELGGVPVGPHDIDGDGSHLSSFEDPWGPSAADASIMPHRTRGGRVR